MSCGCGGKLPARVTLRLEAARLVLTSTHTASEFSARAKEVYEFLTADVDVAALDAPPSPVAVGDSAEAVTSRNALIVQPITRIAGFSRAQQQEFHAKRITNLGALAQFDTDKTALWDQVNIELGRYGLSLAMTNDGLREWVLKGP